MLVILIIGSLRQEVQKLRPAIKHVEKMLTIPGHKGNANQNHIKIPPYSC
jgi:hypothetical protein